MEASTSDNPRLHIAPGAGLHTCNWAHITRPAVALDECGHIDFATISTAFSFSAAPNKPSMSSSLTVP